MRYPPLSPSIDTGARVVFEASAATVEVEPRPDRQAIFSRYAGYYALLSRLPRRLRRRLQRQWRRSLAAIALLLSLGQAPALAATLAVAGVAPDIAPDGSCSLIEAIENANADAPPAHADCPAGSGADTIVLPASSTQTLTQFHNEYNSEQNGLPVTGSAITIEGNGSTIMRVADGTQGGIFRIFAVNDTGNLTLNNTTVSGGLESSGGGVRNHGTLTLMNSTVSGNQAAFSGGGVSNFGTLTLMNSTVSGNGADNGGGVSNGGTLILTNSTLSRNHVGFESGGGLLNFGTATLTDSTVSGNTAAAGGVRQGGGGGVKNSGTLTLINSTVSGNVGNPDPSNLNAFIRGGGVLNYGTLTLSNSTVSGNSAGFGGGVYNFGTLTLKQALISGNTAVTSGQELGNVLAAGNIIANDFNLFGHSALTDAQAFSNFTPGPSDLTATSNGDIPTTLGAILDTTLANNGGPTQTHALIAGSPAVDAVPAANCATTSTDQRGVARPQDGDGDAVAECDVGAFEVVAPTQPPAPTPTAPPPAPDAETAPLELLNPQLNGCELAGDEIACAETGATTLPFIRFDVDIPENAGFLQFDYTFTGADRAVSGAEGLDTAGRSDGEDRRRASVGDLGAVFITNVPIAALPASGVLQDGVFQSSGQSRLPRSGRGTMIIANFASGAAGSVFRVRNLRVDRCAQTCFRKRATLCGTDGPDELTGTRRSDVIVGRRGNDIIKGLGGNDLICGGEGKDKLSGGPGRDRLDGGLGRDTCDGGPGTDDARRCDRKRAIP